MAILTGGGEARLVPRPTRFRLPFQNWDNQRIRKIEEEAPAKSRRGPASHLPWDGTHLGVRVHFPRAQPEGRAAPLEFYASERQNWRISSWFPGTWGRAGELAGMRSQLPWFVRPSRTLPPDHSSSVHQVDLTLWRYRKVWHSRPNSGWPRRNGWRSPGRRNTPDYRRPTLLRLESKPATPAGNTNYQFLVFPPDKCRESSQTANKFELEKWTRTYKPSCIL